MDGFGKDAQMGIRVMTTDNALDFSTLSALGLGWITSIDWVFWTGFMIGAATLIVRIMAYREARRANDLKEFELSKKKRGT